MPVDHTERRPAGRDRRPRTPRLHAFAVTAPGLEPLAAAELEALGLRSARAGRGGVRFTATTRQLYAANLWLRTATRVLVRTGRFEARTFADLEAGAAAVEWARWIDPGRPVRVRVTSIGSRLHHTGAVEERFRRAATLAEPAPDAADDAPLVVVRIAHDQVTVSVDSSGQPLARRGWRLATAKAPLRETLAAALLLAVPWDPGTPLVDPFCGSGTIAVEAALLAAGAAPGRGRTFSFGAWPDFEPGTWASVRAQALEADTAGGDGPVRIHAADRDAGAVDAARANAERAGVGSAIAFERRSISELTTAGRGPGLLLTNPPYGRRVSAGHDLRDLFARLGAVVRREAPGWRIGMLVDDPRTVAPADLALDERLRVDSGGTPVRLLVGDVPD